RGRGSPSYAQRRVRLTRDWTGVACGTRFWTRLSTESIWATITTMKRRHGEQRKRGDDLPDSPMILPMPFSDEQPPDRHKVLCPHCKGELLVVILDPRRRTPHDAA